MKKEEVSEILWIAVFLNEKNDHWICFAHWSLSTVFCDRSVSYRCQGWHPTPCFEFLSAGIFSILALLLDQSKTSPIPAGCLSCHLHLHGLACGDFWWQWSMLWPVPLSVWCALVGDVTCSTFWLVCIGGRSGMNHMVPVGVSLVVCSMTFVVTPWKYGHYGLML